MEKDMETSTFFFRISINEIYAISVNEAYGKNGLETKSGGSLVFVETLG